MLRVHLQQRLERIQLSNVIQAQTGRTSWTTLWMEFVETTEASRTTEGHCRKEWKSVLSLYSTNQTVSNLTRILSYVVLNWIWALGRAVWTVRLKRDVFAYCTVCHTCQFTIKPNQKISPAPLCPVPVVERPFEYLIVELECSCSWSHNSPRRWFNQTRKDQQVKQLISKFCTWT